MISNQNGLSITEPREATGTRNMIDVEDKGTVRLTLNFVRSERGEKLFFFTPGIELIYKVL